MKFQFFVISVKQWHEHHPDKELWPDWTIDLPQSLHMVVNALQRLKITEENYALIHNFLVCVEYVAFNLRRLLDKSEGRE